MVDDVAKDARKVGGAVRTGDLEDVVARRS
jgi:hypothetical protein